MIALAWILLFASTATTELVDDVRRIPPHKWHYFEDLGLDQRPGRVMARFDAGGEDRKVKLVLLSREEFDHFHRGQPYQPVAETKELSVGVMSAQVPSPGDYVMVLHNLSDEPARVHLRVWLQHPRVTTLSPERRLTVVAISFAFFVTVVTFSARALLRGVRR